MSQATCNWAIHHVRITLRTLGMFDTGNNNGSSIENRKENEPPDDTAPLIIAVQFWLHTAAARNMPKENGNHNAFVVMGTPCDLLSKPQYHVFGCGRARLWSYIYCPASHSMLVPAMKDMLLTCMAIPNILLWKAFQKWSIACYVWCTALAFDV